MRPTGRQLLIHGITNQITHYSFKSLLTFSKDKHVQLKKISSYNVLVVLMTPQLKTTNLDLGILFQIVRSKSTVNRLRVTKFAKKTYPGVSPGKTQS